MSPAIVFGSAVPNHWPTGNVRPSVVTAKSWYGIAGRSPLTVARTADLAPLPVTTTASVAPVAVSVVSPVRTVLIGVEPVPLFNQSPAPTPTTRVTRHAASATRICTGRKRRRSAEDLLGGRASAG